jgi:hypothetical protein
LTVSFPGFAYAEGKDEAGTLKSIAIVSERYGPAIFLAPAAKRVLQMIERYRDVGGWPRTRAGHGDYYGVETPYGTSIMMRPAPIWDDGSGRTRGYVVLLPAAATLWMDAVRRFGSWLWALPGGTVHGKQRITFVANLQTNRIVGTIFVNRTSGEARVAGQRSSGSTYGRDLVQGQVEAFAPPQPQPPATPGG